MRRSLSLNPLREDYRFVATCFHNLFLRGYVDREAKPSPFPPIKPRFYLFLALKS